MSNLWKEFESLLPKRKFYIGSVTQIDIVNKLSTIALVGGGIITAKGVSVSVGQSVLIENGVILQELPTLTVYGVTVY